MSRTSALCMLILLSATVAPDVAASDAPSPAVHNAPSFNTIILGWDGAQRDHFLQCYNRGELPNVKALSRGRIWNITVTSGATSTKCGWAQILSGYSADTMGIYDNNDYRPLPPGLSIFEKLKNHFGPGNIITLFIANGGTNLGGACAGEISDPSAPGLGIEKKGQPWCNAQSAIDVFRNDVGPDDAVGDLALELIDRYQHHPFFAFFHFHEPDKTGHESGENSEAYSRALMRNDAWLGRIRAELSDAGLASRTCIYVVSDHGFDKGTANHRNAPYTTLASNDSAIVRNGDRMDIAPTVLDRYGIHAAEDTGLPPVNGSSLHSLPSVACINEDGAFLRYPGAPRPCAGLTIISLAKPAMEKSRLVCIPATGGDGDSSGYVTRCGDGICASPETPCNCPGDCGGTAFSRNTSGSLKRMTMPVFPGMQVQIDIKDILGRDVRRLASTVQQPDAQRIVWNGSDKYGRPVAFGPYLYIVSLNNVSARVEMLIVGE